MANNYKCTTCGKFMKFVPDSGLKYCGNCNTGRYDPQDKSH